MAQSLPISSLPSGGVIQATDATVVVRGGLNYQVTVPVDLIYQNAATLLTKANINSPAFTGVPTAPTAALGTNTTQVATTAFVQSMLDGGAANIVTATLTPTFTAGEEYILSPVNFEGAVQQTIVFGRLFINGTSTNYGTDSVTVVITHNASAPAGSVGIEVISHTLSIDYFGFKTYVLDTPKTINGVTIPVGQVVYVMYLKQSLPATVNTQNTITGDYLSACPDFIDKINNYPILFEPVASGTFTGTTAVLGYVTKANLESPSFTGVPTAPTAAAGTNTTQLATMAAIINNNANYTTTAELQDGTFNADLNNLVAENYVKIGNQPTNSSPGLLINNAVFYGAIVDPALYAGMANTTYEIGVRGTGVTSQSITFDPSGVRPMVNALGTSYDANKAIATLFDLTTKANLASPAFTGVPTAPTAAAGTNTTQVATTQFVTSAVAAGGGLGVGQTWVNVTGSRAQNVNYTNTTGKPIMVQVMMRATTVSDVVGLNYGPYTAMSQFGNLPNNANFSLTGVILPGQAYAVSVTNGSPLILVWAELR